VFTYITCVHVYVCRARVTHIHIQARCFQLAFLQMPNLFAPVCVCVCVDERYRLIMSGSLTKLLNAWKTPVSASALHLLSHLLCPAESRYTIEQIRTHPFMAGAVILASPFSFDDSPTDLTTTTSLEPSVNHLVPTHAATLQVNSTSVDAAIDTSSSLSLASSVHLNERPHR
jgi:hypothetical protein